MKRSLFTILPGMAFGVWIAQADVTPLSSSAKVKFNELPPAAQNAIKAQAGSAEIEDVEKGTLDGRAVYEAAFKQKGQHTELRVAEDGTIVDTIVAGKSTTTASSTTAASASTSTSATPKVGVGQESDAYGAGFVAQLSGAKKIAWTEVPENVKKVFQLRTGTASVEDVDKGIVNRTPVYQAAFKRNGKHVELRVSETGMMAREVANGVPVYWHRPTTWDQVPANIRTQVKSRLGTTPLRAILQAEGTQVGPFHRFIYNKGGQEMELRVSQNGATIQEFATGGIIKESAGAQIPK